MLIHFIPNILNLTTQDSEEEHITSDTNPSDLSPVCDNDVGYK